MDTKKMRVCLPLLPHPGGDVVCECLDEIDRLRGLVAEAATTMRHAEVFISSREKMYQTGQELYRELLKRLE